jgi:hypothetical protein
MTWVDKVQKRPADDDEWENSGEFKRLCRLGIDPYLPDVIIYMLIKNNVITVEQLFAKLKEKYPQITAEGDENNSSE